MGASRNGLDRLFNPRSVAVAGASDDRSKVGGRVLEYLLAGAYGGRVHPLHARQSTVQGADAAASLDALDEPVDTCIVALPPSACVDTVAACARNGVGSVVVLSAGFAESGADGAARQAALQAAARGSTLRILGPNCLGAVNERLRYAGTFATMWKEGWSSPGAVAIVSQSGATASYFYVMLRERGIGISLWASTGNELDVDVAECIGYLAADEHTRVIVAALEGVRDGKRLLDALESARVAGKPVILLKVGRSMVGGHAVQSHTGALAGDDRVFDAAVRQCGAVRGASFEDVVDLAAACVSSGRPRGARIGIVSASGGVGIQMADCAEPLGLDVPALSPDVMQTLQSLVPGCSPGNPVDVTAMVLNDMDLLLKPLDVIARSGEVDLLVAFLTSAFRSDALVAKLCDALGGHDFGVPLVMSGYTSAENLRRLFAAGLPTYVDPARCMAVAAGLVRLAATSTRARDGAGERARIACPVDRDESSLLAFFARHGVPAVASHAVGSADEAVAAATAAGYPVALKIGAPGVAHKSDTGGVKMGLANATETAAAYAALLALSRRLFPVATHHPVTVQPMVTGLREMLLGYRHDPTFGPVVAVGFGGRWVEIVDDVVLRIPPFDRATALTMIDALRGRRLLDGARGEPAADVDALADALVAFGDLCARWDGVASAELNPFLLGRAGDGGRAVDAKVVPLSPVVAAVA